MESFKWIEKGEWGSCNCLSEAQREDVNLRSLAPNPKSSSRELRGWDEFVVSIDPKMLMPRKVYIGTEESNGTWNRVELSRVDKMLQRTSDVFFFAWKEKE